MRRAMAVAATLVALVAGACSGGSESASTTTGGTQDPGDCLAVDVAVSPEKLALLTDLARTFNASDRAKLAGGGCAFVRVARKASGAGMALLAAGWPQNDANGPRPVVWSPASSAWGAILNQRLAKQGQPAMAPTSKPFMRTPLVIAMPEPMARALGWPDAAIGYADILKLAANPEGWGAYGHPEWGPFRLGKTNPNFSTSGLSATIAQYYAATGKTSDLTLEDLDDPQVDSFARSVESAVVHYGDTTLTFLNNWYRNDRRGTGLTYVSAVAVEEKSVVDYNRGNPDGILDAGEKPRPPRNRLIAIYPKEGTLYSDNPFIVLDAPWVSAQQKTAARAFETYIQRAEAQRRALAGGFRPGSPSVPLDAPLNAQNGVDPTQPETLLEVPAPEVLARLLDKWQQHRKRARVLLVLDVSGSMGDEGDPETGATKLDLAKKAVIESLDSFQPDDQVGLWAFTTEVGPPEHSDWLELLPVADIGPRRARLRELVQQLVPLNGTPLYTVTGDSYDELRATIDRERINAVVLLTDGRNEDDRNNDLKGLLARLGKRSEGQVASPVRVFPIAYGAGADLETLRRIAEATNASVYDASDPKSIVTVFNAVISNF